MKNTEAWWVCNNCKKPIVKVGNKGVKKVMQEHLKACDQIATYCIKQVEQGKRGREV